MDHSNEGLNAMEPVFLKSELQTVTLGMGCFWSPEALFGHLPGVIRTRTGYAGGTTSQPTYREMGDHTETVQLEFLPSVIRLEEILVRFWDGHKPANINDYKGRQYQSLLLNADERQREAVEQVLQQRKEQGKGEPDTEIVPYSAFHRAEERHQKYYLKRYPDAMEKLSRIYATEAELVDSTIAARLNGLAKGYTSLERVLLELPQWPMETQQLWELSHLIKQIRW
ncbi:peptide-methionine (S)-S-oxide reductase MsrA [Paenibacillus luteus]|uniref:peptide-methionine (S)-S-oxide reductase MsrA n=1 Tax=Paenibacillus luteus TaxID=2545753 RepID=UPI001142525F|nr:peptide-methionine (S)-S-oxide reductase [Paenibacillus luteus]